MSTTEMVEIVDVCLVGHNNMRVHAETGVATCGTCSDLRVRMSKIQAKNMRAGRHPGETLLRVPVAPLRERYEDLLADGITASTVARRAGYLCGRNNERGDIQRLKRQLGVIVSVSSREAGADGKPLKYFAESVNYDTAVRLCRALWVEYPSEMGI